MFLVIGMKLKEINKSNCMSGQKDSGFRSKNTPTENLIPLLNPKTIFVQNLI